MNAADRSKALEALLSKLRAQHGLGTPAHVPSPAASGAAAALGAEARGPGEAGGAVAGAPPSSGGCPIERCFHGDLVLRELVRSFLCWESTLARADKAMERIAASVVDVNEFRVCLADEIAHILGTGHPRLEDRIARLRAVLGDVYKREHQVRLNHLSGKPKREARTYVESLKDIPAFVASRTALVALDVHTVPVDEQLRSRLVGAGVIDEATDAAAASAQLERAIKAGEAHEAHRLLQAWCDAGGPAPRAPKARERRKPSTTTGRTGAANGKRPPAKKKTRA